MTASVRGRRRTARTTVGRGAGSCPTCGHAPTAGVESAEQHQDLQVTWLVEAAPGSLVVRHFCAECQPRGAVYVIACRACGDGPMLTGRLAEQAIAGELSPSVVDALTATGWRPARDNDGWVCCR
ncbi:MAG TPA: hypothetical protein VGL36_35735 [Kribbella sp.]